MFGDAYKYIAVASIMAWEPPGDAAAAIIGKKFDKHPLSGKQIEGVKSFEGSIAMAVTSFVCALPILLTISRMPWYACLLIVMVTAPVSALVELFTKKIRYRDRTDRLLHPVYRIFLSFSNLNHSVLIRRVTIRATGSNDTPAACAI